MAPFVQDAFVDTDGTLLTAHAGAVGAAWTIHPDENNAPSPMIDATVGLRRGAGLAITCYASGAPPSADYSVTADFNAASYYGSPSGGIWARLATGSLDGYLLDCEGGSFNLYKCLAGVLTLLGTWALTGAADPTPGRGHADTATLNVVGTEISVIVGDVPVISAVDADIADAGQVGVRCYANDIDDGPDHSYDGVYLKNLVGDVAWVPPTQNVDLSGIDSGEAFGGAVVAGPLSPSGIDSGEAFGTADVYFPGWLYPSAVPSAETFGAPSVLHTVHQTLSPVGIRSREAFDVPDVREVGQVLEPAGIDSAEAFGTATVGELPTQFVTPYPIVEDVEIGIPTLTLAGSTTIEPAGIGSTVALGVPILLTPTGVPPGGGGGPPPAPPIPGGETGSQSTAPITPRNYLIDRKTREAYPWPVNHASEDAIKTLGRRLTRSGISASGKLIATRKVFLTRQPSHPGPVHLLLHGSFIDPDQRQYQTFVRFFNSSDDRTFDYIDASGDSYHVAICQFDARRKLSASRMDGSYFTYTLEVEVLEVNHGALKGYAI